MKYAIKTDKTGRIFLSIIASLFIFFMLFSTSLFAENQTSHKSWQDVKLKPSKENVVLTFDDGPSPKYTPKILSILKKNHIKAVFFVEGQFAKRYPELIRQIHADGHVIANHTMHHAMLTRVSRQKMEREISEVNTVVKNIIGIKPRCLRPPYGKHNKTVDRYAHTINLAVLNWDLNSFDYKRKGASVLTNWVLKKTRPGYVLLLHDGGGNRTQTVKALPAIIKGLRKKGLGFELICN